MLITRLYFSRSTLSVLTVLLLLALPACDIWDRIFDPVDEPGRLIALEPKFPQLLVGQGIQLQARDVGDPNAPLSFQFTEDSNGTILQLAILDGNRVLVTAVNPGQATVKATLGEDEGLSIVTVRTE